MQGDDDELSRLLAPVTPEAFVGRYWGREPLYVRGRADKFAGLFDRAAFERLRRDPPRRLEINCSFSDYGNRAAARAGRRPVTRITANQYDAMLAAGATLTLLPLQALEPKVARFAASLKAQLAYAGDLLCTAWLSPPGAGVGAHFDGRAVITLQLEGEKRWRISPRPALPWAEHLGLAREDGTCSYDYLGGEAPEVEPWEEDVALVRDGDLVDVLLRPGDLLYVPAGVYHETRAEGDAPSLALNVDFAPVSFWNVLDLAVRPALRADPAWRHLPPAPAAAEGGRLPAHVKAFFLARLDELRARLDELRGDELALNAAWQELVASLDGPPLAPSPAAGLAPDDVLCLSAERPTTCALGRDGEGREIVYLFHGGREVSFDEPRLVEFGRGLARRRAFAAREALDWAPGLRWDEARELLEVLLREGILTRA
ncbi:MAG TPA: cupin domain-containing protein [Polyangiaceae bacterium]|nr:cupin domain-containing protein [Polyangiaceae bacterium]